MDGLAATPLLALLLQKVGHRVEEAVNGGEGIEKFKTRFFDLVITDIKMPFMDGLTLARHARAIIPWLRIIIVSG